MSFNTTKQVREGSRAIPRLPSQVIDVFNLQCTSRFVQCVLEISFAIHPIGDLEAYKVLWDSDVTTLTQARQRYSAMSGYSVTVGLYAELVLRP